MELHSSVRGDKSVPPHDRSIISAAVPPGKMEPVETYAGKSPSRKISISDSNRSRSSCHLNKLDEYYLKVKNGLLEEQRYEDWARFTECPGCEEEAMIPHDDYICIKCRVIG